MLEIHSALKLLNKNIKKTTVDSKDRYDLISKETQDALFNIDSSVTDLK